MTKNTKSRILLHACPRCQGDLFPDEDENDFACLQCGRRFASAQMEVGVLSAISAKRELAHAA